MKPCIFYGFNRIDFISFDESDDEGEPLSINQPVPIASDETLVCAKHECFIFPEKNVRKSLKKHNLRVENVDTHSVFGILID